MKKIILLVLFVITFSSLCYGQDDFETVIGPGPIYPISLYLGRFKCNCIVVDVGNGDQLVKTDIIFSFTAFPGIWFQIRFDSNESHISYYEAPYFPIGPFIRIFSRDRSVRGWGFKSSGIILLRIEDDNSEIIHSIDCVGIRVPHFG